MSRYLLASFLVGLLSWAQTPAERSFSVPVAQVQAALRKLPGGTSGPLPILDGFVDSGGRSLQGFERPYYQYTVHVTATPSRGSLVHVSAKITAWNTDPAHPGYEVLRSNGRLESDLLDRLEQSLSASASVKSPAGTAGSGAAKSGGANAKAGPAPEISAPMPQLPSASVVPKLPAEHAQQNSGLEQQAKSLEDILRNQGHPTDLVAVKEDQTPVLRDPSSDAKVLFLASAEDEFQVLDMNAEWIHVRISGLSRGWLRRAGVEMLDGSELNVEPAAPAVAQTKPTVDASMSSALFSVSGEEEGNFPGDWPPLKGKSVKIVSIQQAPGTGKITSPRDKMNFAEKLFREDSEKEPSAGLVLIFDAEDGGIVAATRAALQRWKTGALSEEAFWRECYLDPPEILGSAN